MSKKKTPHSNLFGRTGLFGRSKKASLTQVLSRGLTLEALEDRHLLSSVSFSADNLIEANTMKVTFSNELDETDFSERSIQVHIQAVDGTILSADDIKLLDSSSQSVEFLNSQISNGVTTLLAKVVLGSNYTLTIDNAVEDPAYHVLFTVSGDDDCDGVVSSSEYYGYYGETLRGNGLSDRFISVYQNLLGVDLNHSHYNALYDLNGSRTITRSAFDQFIQSNYGENNIRLGHVLSTAPTLESLKVNGETPLQLEDGSYITNLNRDLVVSGEFAEFDVAGGTPQGVITLADATGTEYTATISDLRVSGTYTAETAGGAEASLVYSYDSEDGSFSLTMPAEITLTGSISIVLRYGAEGSENDYTILIDTTAPSISVSELTSTAGNEREGVFYVSDAEFPLSVVLEPDSSATYASLVAEVTDPANGVYVQWLDGIEFIADATQLTAENISQDSEGNITIDTLSKTWTLTEGNHSLSSYTTDFVGNATDLQSLSVVIDLTDPTISVNSGYIENYDSDGDGVKDSMMATTTAVTLTTVMADLNLNEDECKCTITNGEHTTEITPTENDYALTLEYGENTVVFKAEDFAGRATTKTLKIFYNEAPTLTEDGKALAENGVVLSVQEGVEPTVDIELDQMFQDEEALTYEAVSSDTSAATVSIDENGKMTLTFVKTPEETEEVWSYITVTATDKYGAVCTLPFEATYTYDQEAPVLTNVTLEGNYAESTLSDFEYITSAENLVLNGTLYDATGIATAFMDVYCNGSIKIPSLNLLQDSSDLTYTYTYDAETQACKLTLLDADEGTYSLRVYGTDTNGNESTATSGYQQIGPIVRDATAPGVTATMTVQTTGSSETIVGGGLPKFDLDFTGELNEQDQANGVWVQIYVAGVSTPYASGKYAGGETELTYSLETLKDGKYTFRIQMIDAAGNVTQGNSMVVTYDTTAPTVKLSDNFQLNYDSDGDGKLDSMYTTESKTLTLNATVVDTNGGTLVCKLNGSVVAESQETAGDYVLNLVYGENSLEFTATDPAGNVGTRSETIYYDTVPEVVAGASLLDRTFKLTGDGQTFDISFAISDLETMFTDADIPDGDMLDYVFSFEVASEELADAITSTSAGVEGDYYVMSFKVADEGGYDALKNVLDVGTISVFARDIDREHSDTLTCKLLKSNQPVEKLKDSIAVTQDATSETPSYVLDLSDVFRDPEGESWYVEEGVTISTVSSEETQAKVNGTVVVNEGGTSLTWTPETGLYGNAVVTLSVTDASGATLDTTLNLQVKWAGMSITLTEQGEAGITLDEGGVFSPTDLTVYATFGNEFDASQAWGGYTVDDTVSVSVVEQDVHGYAVDGTNARTFKYTSLFEVDPTLNTEGKLVFVLNTHAYGTATLRLSVEGTANYADLQLTVNDLAADPYAADYTYAQPLSLTGTTSTTYNLLEKCNAASDEGDVALTGITQTSGMNGFTLYDADGNELATFDDVENPPAEGMAYCVVKTEGTSNSWDIVIANDGECCTFRVALVMNSSSELTGTLKVTQLDDGTCTMDDCSLLAGTRIVFGYEIENATTKRPATGQVDLELAISIHNLYVGESDGLQITRQFSEYSFSYDILEKLRLDDSWVISSVTLNTDESDESMKVSYDLATETFQVEEGSYGMAVFDYEARDSNGELHSAQIIMSVQVINTPPTWVDGTEASGKVYSWTVTQNAQNPVYTLTDKTTGKAVDVSTLFTDYDTEQSKLTIEPTEKTLRDESGNVVGELSISAGNVLSFTAAEGSFTTDALSFSLTVTDEALVASEMIASAESAEFGFTLKIVAEQEAPVFADVPGISTSVGETVTINLNDYKAYVINAGENLTINLLSGSSLVPTGTENEYTFTSDEMGVFSFVIEAYNGEKYSDPQTVYIAVGDSVEVVDSSLNIVLKETKQEVVTSGNSLSETRVLASDLNVDGGSVLKAGSVLKEGTFLRSGTVIPKGATFSAKPDFVGFIDELWDEESGTYNDGDAFGLNHDWTMNCDLTLQTSSSASRNMTIVNSAILEEGSTLVKGTTFSAETTVYYTESLSSEQITEQMNKIKQIYADAQTKSVALSDLNTDVQSATMQLGDASSYEVTSISGKTVTIALKAGKAANAENLLVNLDSGYTLILGVTGECTLDVSDYTSGRTIKSVSQSGSTFREVALEPNSTTAFYVTYNANSSNAYGEVVLKLDNSELLTVRIANAPVYPTQDISLNLNGMTIQSVKFVDLPENSCYASVSATSTGIQVAYMPYQVGQDRSDVDVAVTLADGTQMIVTLETQYEQPFSYYVTLSSSADKSATGDLVTELQSLSSITNTPETYYAEVWVQCNLPTYQTGLISEYGLYSIIPYFSLTANAEAVSSITAESTVYTQLWSASGLTMTGTALYLSSGTVGSAADGTYARLGLFKIETTGAADLQLALSYPGKAEMSILYDSSKNIGIYAGSDNYISAKQVEDFDETLTFPSLASSSSSMWMYETNTAESPSLKSASTSMEVSTTCVSNIVDETAWETTLVEALQKYETSLNDAVWVDDDAWQSTPDAALSSSEGTSEETTASTASDDMVDDAAWEEDFWAE